MKKTKLANSLEKFMLAYYAHYGTIGPQIIFEMMGNYSEDSSLDDLFALLSKDKAEVIDTLQKSVAINQVFSKIRNDFVEDLMKNLRDMSNLQEEDKRESERLARDAAASTEKGKKIKQLTEELDLSPKQKQILKAILDLQ